MNSPITPETEEKLRSATNGSLNEFYPLLAERERQINQLDITMDFLCTHKGTNAETDDILKLQNIKRLTEYYMLITIFHLDLSVIINLFLNGKSEYEKLFALKQGMVIINEGYKKIFNFVIIKNDGSFNYSQRNQSFWNKEIRQISNRYPQLSTEFELITNQLDDYYKISFDSIKEIRDLTVHYDKEPVKFNQMLISLDTETIFVKLTGFVKILSRMYLFISLVMSEISTDISDGRDKVKISLDSTFTKIESALNKPEIDKDFKTEILGQMDKLKRFLDF